MERLYKMEAESFNDLPMRCKEMFFEKMEEYTVCGTANYGVFIATGFDYSSCKSPIEKIFCFAFDILCNEKELNMCLCPQHVVVGKSGKKYYADFLFDDDTDRDGDFLENCYFQKGIPGIIIECDGHDYHSTKKQIKEGNERDFDLKSNGFEILHFSGSQIFTDPWRCAGQALDFILEKLGRVTKVE